MNMSQFLVAILLLVAAVNVNFAQQLPPELPPISSDKVASRLDEIIKEFEDTGPEVTDRDELLDRVRELIRRRRKAMGGKRQMPDTDRETSDPVEDIANQPLRGSKLDKSNRPLKPTSGRRLKPSPDTPAEVATVPLVNHQHEVTVSPEPVSSVEIATELAQLKDRVERLEEEMAQINRKLFWLNNRQKKLTKK